MNIYKINILGKSYKTIEKKHRLYARCINECYNDLCINYRCLVERNISKEIYLLYYFIYYNKIHPYINKLYDDKCITFDDMLYIYSAFDDYVAIVKYIN